MGMIKDTDQWISSVREVSLLPEKPVQQQDGRWKVAERLDAWKAIGPRIFDSYLDSFQKLALKVLRERDPQFDLERDKRYAANIVGKVLKHSHDLRRGLAETLALLGNYPEFLENTTLGKPEGTARLVVRKTLQDANWEIWASLNDLLPLLSEAAPKEFLDAIETSLASDPCPFDGVFAQEGSGFSGNNYMTGLLWGLENLAWDPDYLTRVIVILGELAARDPGGNWGNRPGNSLHAILLPWFPQTLAPPTKRVAAVATLQKEQPEVAWTLLLTLLPQTHGSTSGTHKPTWRKTIPADWKEGATNAEHLEQVTAYAEMAATQAIQDSRKLASFIDHLNQLPKATRQKVVQHLSSEGVLSLPSEARLTLWNELVDFISRHRKYASADWALHSEEIETLALTAAGLEPHDAKVKYRRLFTQRDFNLYEESDNFAEQAERLFERRKAAVRELYTADGVDAVQQFAESVESPAQVGFAFGAVASAEDEQLIIPGLFESESPSIIQFRAGFVTGRFRAQGWTWVDSLVITDWSNEQKAVLLSYLPFSSETWARARNWLENEERLYWEKTYANAYEATNEELPSAIDRLIDHGRPIAAISALEKLIYSKGEVQPHQIARALNALLQSQDGLKNMDAHAVTHLIGKLQADPDTNQDELFKLEWAFLALLDGHFGVSPTLLQKTLAKDPNFFCEIVRAVFRSTKDDAPKTVSEEQEAIATQGHRLLMEWRIPPGSFDDGMFDALELNKWLEVVKGSCSESGHLKIAMQQVGEVLFYAPADPSGLWIHQAVAEVLNAKDAADLRLGYEIETINSRGVHAVDPQGKGERELANHYRKRAEEVELRGFHRLAGTLRDVAESYDREAEQIVRRFYSE
jgi:hypothetical protein